MDYKENIGSTFIDERGKLSFCNDFDLSNYKRFYDIQNFNINFIRAWHGHKHEKKAVFVRKGNILLGLVKIDDFQNPSKKLNVNKVFLSAEKPMIVEIPDGYANGFMNLSSDTIVTFYSNKSLSESANDDYRFPYDYWNIWNIEYR